MAVLLTTQPTFISQPTIHIYISHIPYAISELYLVHYFVCVNIIILFNLAVVQRSQTIGSLYDQFSTPNGHHTTPNK